MFSKMRLGCRPRPQGVQTLKFRKYANSSQLPPSPLMLSWQAKVASWPMLDNDTLGDCVPAGIGHILQSMAANVGGASPFVPTAAQAVSAYELLGGYVPGNPATDQGCVITTSLSTWQQKFVYGNKLDAFLEINVPDHAGVVEATYLLGGLITGVNLPLAWQTTKIWTAPSSYHRFGQWAPGSWGGHCVPVVGYDANYLYVVSWGQVIPVTWAAWDMYFSEAYGLLDNQWFNGQRVAPNGFDLATIRVDMKLLPNYSIAA